MHPKPRTTRTTCMMITALALVTAGCGGGSTNIQDDETARMVDDDTPGMDDDDLSGMDDDDPSGMNDDDHSGMNDDDDLGQGEDRPTLRTVIATPPHPEYGKHTRDAIPAGTEHTLHLPVENSGQWTMIGNPYGRPSQAITPAPPHEGANGSRMLLATGTAPQGTDAERLFAMFESETAGTYQNRIYLQANPMEIRIATGTPPVDIDTTYEAVRMINSALPREWRLTIADELDPNRDRNPPEGVLRMLFIHRDLWPPECANGNACAGGITSNDERDKYGSGILFAENTLHQPPESDNPNDHRDKAATLAHEIMHVLGRLHPDPERFPDSVMTAKHNSIHNETLLQPIDRDALWAMYARFDSEDTREDMHRKLGPWETEAFHLMGELPDGAGADDSIWIGVSSRNGKQDPWALGPSANEPPSPSDFPSGTVRWEGRLLGMTPQNAPVAGEADIRIELDTSSGNLQFSDLEQWEPSTAPGAVGTGELWGDGSLGYGIKLTGNTFVEDGTGDDGVVTGQLFGNEHQGAGGTLDRDDLQAAFAATRD